MSNPTGEALSADLVITRDGVPVPDQAQGIKDFKAACLGAAERARKHEALCEAIRFAINSNSLEAGSNTPDFVIADHLMTCFLAFEAAVNRRDKMRGA